MSFIKLKAHFKQEERQDESPFGPRMRSPTSIQ